MIIKLFDNILDNERANCLARMLPCYNKNNFFAFIIIIKISYGWYNII